MGNVSHKSPAGTKNLGGGNAPVTEDSFCFFTPRRGIRYRVLCPCGACRLSGTCSGGDAPGYVLAPRRGAPVLMGQTKHAGKMPALQRYTKSRNAGSASRRINRFPTGDKRNMPAGCRRSICITPQAEKFTRFTRFASAGSACTPRSAAAEQETY